MTKFVDVVGDTVDFPSAPMPGADPATQPSPRLLHWLTALLVLGLIGVGLWMVGLPIGIAKLYAFAWHKWIGLTVLVLTVLA